MTKITYIPGEIANAAIDEHGNRKPVTRTQHIFDDAKGKNQAEINADVDDTFALHQSEINALDSQNYVTVDTFGELPATGVVDTIYRVANYDGTQVVTNKYAEYAWNGTQYKLLDVKEYGIDDVPTAGSDNLVKSGGVYPIYKRQNLTLEENTNLCWGESVTKNGLTVTFGENGTSFNGTTNADTFIYLGIAKSLTTSILPAGTYTALFEIVKGNESETNSISLRYGATAEDSQSNGTRWVNASVKKEKQEFITDTVICIYVPSGYSYNNVVVRIQINVGEEIKDWEKGSLSSIDSIGRKDAQRCLDTVGVVTETYGNNLFWGIDQSINGLSIKWTSNGLLIDGTASAPTYVYLGKARGYKDSILPAGKYSASFREMTTPSIGNDVSLRYGNIDGSILNNGTSFVNNVYPENTVEFANETIVALYIVNGTVFSNSLFRIQLNSGENLYDWVNGGLSAVDKESRQRLNQLDGTSEERENLFYGSDDELNGLQIKWVENGIKLVGTTSQNTAILIHGHTQIANSKLPAGTYSASLMNISGNDFGTAVSLRYGATGTTLPTNGSRWVNNSVPIYNNIQFDEETTVILFVVGETTLDNILQVQIKKGSKIDKWSEPGLSAIDSYARNALAITNTDDFENGLICETMTNLNSILDDNTKSLLFSYITDTHIDQYQTNRIGEKSLGVFASKVNNIGDFSVHFGDIVQSTDRTAPEALSNILNVLNYLKQPRNLVCCRGNHDTNFRPLNPINGDIWNGIFRQSNHIGIIHNDDDASSLYGYFDLDEYKVRVYIVDAYDALTTAIRTEVGNDYAFISNTQIQWLFSTNAIVQEGWTALVLCHPNVNQIWTVDEKDYLIEHGNDTPSYYTLKKTLYDNILSNEIPVIWLHGDVHADATSLFGCRTSGSSSNYKHALDISFDNAFYAITGTTDVPVTNKDKYCLGILALNTVNSVLFDNRIGRGHNRIWHYDQKEIAVNETVSLTTTLEGTISWTVSGNYISVDSYGVVTGVSSGICFAIATNENEEKEYYIIKVS